MINAARRVRIDFALERGEGVVVAETIVGVLGLRDIGGARAGERGLARAGGLAGGILRDVGQGIIVRWRTRAEKDFGAIPVVGLVTAIEHIAGDALVAVAPVSGEEVEAPFEVFRAEGELLVGEEIVDGVGVVLTGSIDDIGDRKVAGDSGHGVHDIVVARRDLGDRATPVDAQAGDLVEPIARSEKGIIHLHAELDAREIRLGIAGLEVEAKATETGIVKHDGGVGPAIERAPFHVIEVLGGLRVRREEVGVGLAVREQPVDVDVNVVETAGDREVSEDGTAGVVARSAEKEVFADLLVEAEVEIIKRGLPGITAERGGTGAGGDGKFRRAAEDILQPGVRKIDGAENRVGGDIGRRTDHELAADGNGGAGIAALGLGVAVPIDDCAAHHAGGEDVIVGAKKGDAGGIGVHGCRGDKAAEGGRAVPAGNPVTHEGKGSVPVVVAGLGGGAEVAAAPRTVSGREGGGTAIVVFDVAPRVGVVPHAVETDGKLRR